MIKLISYFYFVTGVYIEARSKRKKNTKVDVPTRSSRRKSISTKIEIEERQNEDTNETQLTRLAEHAMAETKTTSNPMQSNENLE